MRKDLQKRLNCFKKMYKTLTIVLFQTTARAFIYTEVAHFPSSKE